MYTPTGICIIYIVFDDFRLKLIIIIRVDKITVRCVDGFRKLHSSAMIPQRRWVKKACLSQTNDTYLIFQLVRKIV